MPTKSNYLCWFHYPEHNIAGSLYSQLVAGMSAVTGVSQPQFEQATTDKARNNWHTFWMIIIPPSHRLHEAVKPVVILKRTQNCGRLRTTLGKPVVLVD